MPIGVCLAGTNVASVLSSAWCCLCCTQGPTAAARVNQVAAHVRDLGRLAPHLFDERFARAADAAAAASHRGPQHPVPHSDAEAHGSQATPTEPPHHPQPVGAHKAHPKAHKPRKPAPPPRPRKPVIPDFDDVDAAVVDNHGSFRERKVPAGPMSRVFGFSQLVRGLCCQPDALQCSGILYYMMRMLCVTGSRHGRRYSR